jgi:hypothetical protein
MKPAEIVLRSGKRENNGGGTASTYVNITMYNYDMLITF